MENTTIIQVLEDGMRLRFSISKYLIDEKKRTIKVFFDEELLAPLVDKIISSKEDSYTLGEEFFESYENTTFDDYKKAGIDDLQKLFRGRAIAKISEIRGIVVGD